MWWHVQRVQAPPKNRIRAGHQERESSVLIRGHQLEPDRTFRANWSPTFWYAASKGHQVKDFEETNSLLPLSLTRLTTEAHRTGEKNCQGDSEETNSSQATLFKAWKSPTFGTRLPRECKVKLTSTNPGLPLFSIRLTVRSIRTSQLLPFYQQLVRDRERAESGQEQIQESR